MKNPTNLLTFDVEEWFHILQHPINNTPSQWHLQESRVEKNMCKILSLLESTDNKATFFFMGWIAERYPHLVQAVASKGHEIGIHGYHHTLPTMMTEKEFHHDIERSLKSISKLGVTNVTSYRAPGFAINKDNLHYLKILLKYGIDTDSSIVPARHTNGGIKHLPINRPFLLNFKEGHIKEFPIPVLPLCKTIYSGGGYFRLFPYALIKLFKSDYFLSYFHPREFDPQQPRLIFDNILLRWRFYQNINVFDKKFHKFVIENHFTSLQNNNIFDWDNIIKINTDFA